MSAVIDYNIRNNSFPLIGAINNFVTLGNERLITQNYVEAQENISINDFKINPKTRIITGYQNGLALLFKLKSKNNDASLIRKNISGFKVPEEFGDEVELYVLDKINGYQKKEFNIFYDPKTLFQPYLFNNQLIVPVDYLGYFDNIFFSFINKPDGNIIWKSYRYTDGGSYLPRSTELPNFGRKVSYSDQVRESYDSYFKSDDGQFILKDNNKYYLPTFGTYWLPSYISEEEYNSGDEIVCYSYCRWFADYYNINNEPYSTGYNFNGFTIRSTNWNVLPDIINIEGEFNINNFYLNEDSFKNAKICIKWIIKKVEGEDRVSFNYELISLETLINDYLENSRKYFNQVGI